MKRDIFDLSGRVALVTGGSRGIGRAIAKTLAAYGAEVILTSRKIEGLAAVAEEIKADNGKACCLPCHVGEMAQIEALFTDLKKRYDKIDILVNNAATNPYFGDVLNADEGVWDKTCAVNLKGFYFMSQHAAKWMKEKGGGAIVNVASVNGIKPAPLQGIYSITKAGVIAMTQAFAKELASYNIRVNALLPGLTDTKFAAALTQNEQILNMVLPTIPMGRIAKPQEMAGAVLYLCSDAASYTTGTCVVCDGGMLA
ncbi:MAG: SDR family oxidoreductase [Smithellaceae bacterium]|nr:SDR family oxidoreductase [Smithellaceae bacterium]